MEPVLAFGRHLLSGTQLGGRQSGWHAGPVAPAAAPALRLLCGPHRRQLRRAGAYEWARAFGIHASVHRDWPAGSVSDAFHPVLPGHLHSGRIPTFVLVLRPHRIAHSTVRRQRGAFVSPYDLSRTLPPVRRRRRGWTPRHDGHVDLLHRAQYAPSLRGGANSMNTNLWRSAATRWLKFNLVGGMGIVVQMLMLVVLKTGLHVNYLIATALAVESAVLHNFLWHERFTWPDRTGASFTRFLKFSLTTGLFSIAGNLVLMKQLVGIVHLNYLLANGLTITTCSL